MIDPSAAMTGITTTLALLQQVATLAGSITDAKSKATVLELQAKLGEAQGKIAEVTASLTQQVAESYRLQNDLHKTLDALKSAQEELKKRGDVQLHGNVRWTRGDPNPNCAICRGKDSKDIPLLRAPDRFFCRVCGTGFGQPQPPPDFGISSITWPPPPPPEPPYESEFERARR